MKKTLIAISTLLPLAAGSAFAQGPGGGGNGGGGMGNGTGAGTGQLNAMEQLGRMIYFDQNLSSSGRQSCASCHLPRAGFADPDSFLPTSEGAVRGLFGNRNSPTSSYAAYIPDFQYDENTGEYMGGQFWDGRAIDLVEQAKGPFLNPVEMNMASEAEVIAKIRQSGYADQFEQVFGPGSLDNVATAYQYTAEAIASFESTHVVNRFNSKYDQYLAGTVQLTAQEMNGLQLFEGKGNCVQCHSSRDVLPNGPEVFSNFRYENIGVPRNPNNPFYTLPAEYNPDGANFVDLGLGGALNDPAQNGKFRVQTLRNIAATPPYMHNGIYNTLHEVVEFHNSRFEGTDKWAPPEVYDNLNATVGSLNLTPTEVDDIVAFLETLTDEFGNGPGSM